ncbi:MAG: GAF domain-containing protein [Alphaproteobacteria bacterium]|nr:GAF domain-containing protein [Alphaproteobacteria bacterium]
MLRQGYRPDLNALRRQMLGPDRGVQQIADFRELLRSAPDDVVVQAGADVARLGTVLFVPLYKDNAFLGRIVAARQEVRPFSDKQIALLQNFAAQAVIAMENARLLGELRERTHDLEESLEYQTAISDVLQVISRSTFDLVPVLQTVVSTALRLCRADQAVLYRNVGGLYRWAAGASLVPEYEQIEREVMIRPSTGTLVGRAALEARTVHILDAAADPLYEPKSDAKIAGVHTMLGVPLLRDGEPIGVIGLARQRVEAYGEKEIELVRTFADQAVIAIENTRLLTELRESLEQQQAIAEVLQVINSSPGNLQPVFDSVLEKATHLCRAQIAVLWMYDGDQMDATAILGAPPEYERFLRQGARPLSPAHERLRAGEEVIQIVNVPEYEGYRSGLPMARALFDLGRVRTILLVPLRSEDEVRGAFAVYRGESLAFSESQIALLQSFAAQAVIAMDNARLLNEIRQRQAELRVTFDNMGDGVAMFDGELRLAAWNLNFQRILDLPDGLLATRPRFSEYFRYLAERGEFGSADVEAELSRRLETITKELRFEHTRPDGRAVEVRRNAVPGGGFVIIYSDVTERKRAEAEIRAARDAAQTALRELKAAQANLIHAEKMASLGQLTAGIAHEIKNPLNFVNNFAGLSVELLDELKETAAPAIATLAEDERADVDELVAMLTGNLEKIAEHGSRADGIVKSMLAHSRGASGERRAVDINALVDEALNLAYHGARAQDQSFNIALERDLDGNAEAIEVVPQDVMRVFLNLFGNGFYAANRRCTEMNNPELKPILKVSTRDLGEAIEVRVRDNGVGIAPEIRDKLFQPFVTTKPTGEGTGLGLSISYDIITQQHGGTIEVDSEVGEFTEFTIRLPRNRQGTSTGNTP